MQIADILSSHLEPGAVIVDLTPAAAALSEHTRLPPHLEVSYRHDLPATPLRGQAIVLQLLGDAVALDVAALAARVVQVVFLDRLEAAIEHGLLERMVEAGRELAATYTTGHAGFPFALVVTAAASEVSSTRLRVLNEYRFDKLVLREHDAEQQRLARQLARVTARLDEASGRLVELEQQVAARDQELVGLRVACVAARQAAAEQAALASSATARLDGLRRRLAKARGSLSFRLGRATRVALREAGRDPLGVPRRWVATFGGPDELIDELDEG